MLVANMAFCLPECPSRGNNGLYWPRMTLTHSEMREISMFPYLFWLAHYQRSPRPNNIKQRHSSWQWEYAGKVLFTRRDKILHVYLSNLSLNHLAPMCLPSLPESWSHFQGEFDCRRFKSGTQLEALQLAAATPLDCSGCGRMCNTLLFFKSRCVHSEQL